MVTEETKLAFNTSKPLTLTEDIAGSNAQSAILERLDVVAIGTPFKSKLVGVAVKTWPSKSRYVVETAFATAIADDITSASIVLTFRLLASILLTKIELVEILLTLRVLTLARRKKYVSLAILV